MKVFELRFRRGTEPHQFSSAVISSFLAVSTLPLLVRAAWPYIHLYALAGATCLLILIVVTLAWFWKLYKAVYPVAVEGDKVLTQTWNAAMRLYNVTNAGFALLVLIVFVFTTGELIRERASITGGPFAGMSPPFSKCC